MESGVGFIYIILIFIAYMSMHLGIKKQRISMVFIIIINIIITTINRYHSNIFHSPLSAACPFQTTPEFF